MVLTVFGRLIGRGRDPGVLGSPYPPDSSSSRFLPLIRMTDEGVEIDPGRGTPELVFTGILEGVEEPVPRPLAVGRGVPDDVNTGG